MFFQQKKRRKSVILEQLTRVRDTASKMSSSQSGINHRAIRTGRLIFKQMPFTAKERAARRIQAPRNRN